MCGFKSLYPSASVAQLVEQGSCKAKVGGSSPFAGSMKAKRYDSSDWLTGMLYTLMRDVVPPGEMERIVKDMEEEDRSGDTVFSNGYLAKIC